MDVVDAVANFAVAVVVVVKIVADMLLSSLMPLSMLLTRNPQHQ